MTLAHFPGFSEDALHILRTADDPRQAFSDKFGDYFVGGYMLGGANSTVVWATGASERSSEHLDVSFDVHLLFLSYSDSISRHQASFASAGTASLAAFDSVDAYQTHVEAHDFQAYMNAIQASHQNRLRGAALQERVRAKLKALNLGSSGAELPWERCGDLCASGLVLELLMLPWAGLRDYASAILADRV